MNMLNIVRKNGHTGDWFVWFDPGTTSFKIASFIRLFPDAVLWLHYRGWQMSCLTYCDDDLKTFSVASGVSLQWHLDHALWEGRYCPRIPTEDFEQDGLHTLALVHTADGMDIQPILNRHILRSFESIPLPHTEQLRVQATLKAISP